MDLFSELEKKINELNISLKKLRETGTEYAEAEREEHCPADQGMGGPVAVREQSHYTH